MIAILGAILLTTPQVTIGLTNGITEIDQRTTYTIRAVNHEPTPLAANVRITLPPGLQKIKAPGASVGETHASWTIMMPPGENIYHLTGTLRGDPGSAVAATACVYAGDLSRPLVCSTDIDELPDPPVTPGGGVLSAFLVLLVLAGGAGTGYLTTRTRRERHRATI
ncbi:hypothetical protein Acor_56490 [Acrocarpospora corrugata]|uniref:DUF11 domain-containing protein n=1 Tax=Acrocarpospora corrugata TaxID=35763 RepID=A0A5M3W8S7_9ACTN|nr:hypothetical protein [Acrocarpospora corrugata]GES03583.1 hypothetical protein Acor_56490 [Acrocarpospora corrugata]